MIVDMFPALLIPSLANIIIWEHSLLLLVSAFMQTHDCAMNTLQYEVSRKTMQVENVILRRI